MRAVVVILVVVVVMRVRCDAMRWPEMAGVLFTLVGWSRG
jgi:hypothetical protein